MKILTPTQIREVDQYTVENEPIPSIGLMERASEKATDWIINHSMVYDFFVFCGVGNNGGDGLVIARLLKNLPVNIKVYLIKVSDQLSPDALQSLERLKNEGGDVVCEVSSHSQINFEEIGSGCVVIDAIFGSGLNRQTEGLAKEVIDSINRLDAKVIAIDSPSGLLANYDKESTHSGGIIKADVTLSFQMPKLSFMLAENEQYVGQWEVLDIGLSQEGIEKQASLFEYIEEKNIADLVKKRKKFSHKGDYGHGLLIAGSYGKMGAAILASKACLKSGAGLLTAHIPHWGYQIMQNAVPEAMTSIDRSEMIFTEFPDLSKFNAIGIGPGLDTKKNSAQAFEEVLNNVTHQKMVIDADGLNILSENKFLLVKLPKNTILTPHPKEFERLAGLCKNEMHRLEILQAFCKQYDVITVLKGAHTVIGLPDGTCVFNSTGNAGMATAGSGDVMTGVVLGLLAQGYCEKDAALLGVYVHGLAGDMALGHESEESLIASDIISNMGSAFKKIRKNKY